MLFSSPRYFVFLAVVLLLLSLKLTLRGKKNVMVVASCLFYAAWDYRYLALLTIISVIDYVAAAEIHKRADGRPRYLWVLFSVVSNLAILGYFKYYNFFLGNLNGVLAMVGGEALPYKHILLPAGISFYTFKSMSYTIDVYRRVIKPCASWLDYMMFITFFPELIAGPIVRASVFLPQMLRLPGPTRDRLKVGAGLFVVGLLKKRVIADNIAAVVDPIFANPELYDAATLWLGVIGYAVQIYCDFSGYSDMAVGTAKMIGYDLPENFAMPYLSTNITIFWRRWHMTLSHWLRDYLYIPLGGNRKGKSRTYVNLFLTMLLGGLWHGASWNFILWGALHGSALALHKLYMERTSWRMPAWLGGGLTFLFVILCWVPFRAPTFEVTAAILRGLVDFGPGVSFLSPIALGLLALVAVGHAIGGRIARPSVRGLLARFGLGVREDAVSGWSLTFEGGSVQAWALLTLTIFAILWGASMQSSPFIYFQF